MDCFTSSKNEMLNYRQNPNYSDIQKFAVITLKFEQDGFTKESCTQKMQLELQIV